MKKFIPFAVLFCLVLSNAIAQDQNAVTRIEPPNWWTGMKEPFVQVLVHGYGIGEYHVSVKYPGVELLGTDRAESPNYLFINLSIDPSTRPGTVEIRFTHKDKKTFSYPFPLLARAGGSANRTGVGYSDVIYLLMPDRFANGDTTNDDMPGMTEKMNRSNPDGRHGGDIRGIRDHLDYLKTLGITSIWINPLLENNMPGFSYHGYAITDFYRIDPRFGTNEDYRSLCSEAHNTGLMVIMDMVFNHCGLNHWWMKDLPFSDWIHSFPRYTPSNYRAESLMDPYASERDREVMSNGWFDRTMPDLNQKNPFVANYLIQNSIWWVELAGLDGIRMDTYPYSDQVFMKRWIDRINAEYPRFRIIKEAWLQTVSQTASYESNPFPYSSAYRYPHAFTDFPLSVAMNHAFIENDGWTTGVSRLYYVLSQDFLYGAPYYAITFADNHDISRFYSTQKEELASWKMGIAFLFTTRGIPMVYYGTESLMSGLKEEGDGALRKDFPGGWPGDSTDFFRGANLTTQQKEAQSFLQSIIRLRKEHPSLQSGAMKHFVPDHGVYVYFRNDDVETIMVIMNNNKAKTKTVDTGRFKESIIGKTRAKDLLNGATFNLEDSLVIQPKSVLILQLQ